MPRIMPQIATISLETPIPIRRREKRRIGCQRWRCRVRLKDVMGKKEKNREMRRIFLHHSRLE